MWRRIAEDEKITAEPDLLPSGAMRASSTVKNNPFDGACVRSLHGDAFPERPLFFATTRFCKKCKKTTAWERARQTTCKGAALKSGNGIDCRKKGRVRQKQNGRANVNNLLKIGQITSEGGVENEP